MGHYGSEMQSLDESERRRDETRRIFALRAAGYQASAFPHSFYGRYHNGKPLHHTPCGQAIYNPVVHDPLCPANNNGREEPMLAVEPLFNT